ncbi:recombinase family protein [Brevibacterium sp. LE-L]|uniref:recombinase family protein n=1 Tax=Brevibacterium sp. LE-L TaxID=3418557 RepID=UPI003CF79221
MRRLLDDAEDGDLIVIWRIRRLGRSVLEVSATVNLPRRRGAEVRSASDNSDPGDAGVWISCSGIRRR